MEGNIRLQIQPRWRLFKYWIGSNDTRYVGGFKICVIIWKQINHYISDKRLREAHNANPDGCGIMWAADNKIFYKKGLWDFKQFLHEFHECYRLFGDRDFVLHFRTASASAIGNEYCHPFFVSDTLTFMQNGNLFEFMYGKGKSDVQRFNEEILQRLPTGFLGDGNIRNKLERYAKESFSKFIFLDNNNRIEIINEGAGEWRHGIWYSNGGIDNYVGYGYSGAYYYNEEDIRHKGGLMSVQMLGGNKIKWEQCEKCKGWFRRERLSMGICAGCWTLDKLRSYCV